MKYRLANPDCLCCGGQLPREVGLEQSRDFRTYRCAKCGDWIIRGIVATDGEYASTPQHPPPFVQDQNEAIVPEHSRWSTWEVWWTDRHWVCAIHGVPVTGEEKLYSFLSKVRDNDGS